MKFKRDTFLSFAPPSIDEAEINEVVDTLRSGWITTGPKAKRFEEDFEKYIGCEGALAVSSCTAALQIALRCFNIGAGDEVITTVMTFSSGVMAIEDVGAKPILVDVEAETLNIDPEKVKEVIKKHPDPTKIKAIIPVHFAGHPCEMGEILKIAKEYNLKVIEDAAHAIPAAYEGKMVGSIGDLTAFSFYVTKNMTTAEGGMLTGSKELMKEARILSLHGISQDAWKRYAKEGSWYYEVVRHGFKANMSDIQAAMGIHQLKKLEGFWERRRELAEHYTKAFEALDLFDLPITRDNVRHAWHLYIVRLREDKWAMARNQFIEELKERNIGASVHFIPIHLHPYFRDKYQFKPDDYPVALNEYGRMLSIPLNPTMTKEDVDDVVKAVSDIKQCEEIQK